MENDQSGQASRVMVVIRVAIRVGVSVGGSNGIRIWVSVVIGPGLGHN